MQRRGRASRECFWSTCLIHGLSWLKLMGRNLWVHPQSRMPLHVQNMALWRPLYHRNRFHAQALGLIRSVGIRPVELKS